MWKTSDFVVKVPLDRFAELIVQAAILQSPHSAPLSQHDSTITTTEAHIQQLSNIYYLVNAKPILPSQSLPYLELRFIHCQKTNHELKTFPIFIISEITHSEGTNS